jgi:aerobic carbon-monoxide dehydrogenase small subunit
MPKKAAKKLKPARKKPAKVLKAESGAKPPQSVETPIANVTIRLTVNGKAHELSVEPRLLLVELLREQLDLTGTHVGCDTTYCGACTVLMNGLTVKSCTMFAVQADGAELLTVEGLAKDGELHPIQKAFGDSYGLQCGYCTPGLMLSTYQLLSQNAKPSEKEIRKAIAGNTCRCTGYQNIFKAIQLAAQGGKGA